MIDCRAIELGDRDRATGPLETQVAVPLSQNMPAKNSRARYPTPRLWLRCFKPFLSTLQRMPPSCRPALFYETFYNIGSGAFVALFGLALATLKSEVFTPGGTKEHLMFVAAMFGGSSLLSPLVGYCGKNVSMRLMVIVPNLVAAGILFATCTLQNAGFFAAIIGVAFIIRVFPRVAEMNMFRVLYPATHRGTAVGWVKAVAAVSGLCVTVAATFWVMWRPALYFVPYWAVGIALACSAFAYARIPVRQRLLFRSGEDRPPHRAFWSGARVFLADRRFVLYQIGFFFAGFANHMAHAFVAESLKVNALASDRAVFWIVAVIPALCMAGSAPLWGRLLDRMNPMSGRALFNSIQCVAYGFHCYGGLTQQAWPFLIGSIVHAVGMGGSTINWLTGSLYFADRERVTLYNSIHVALTGLRGLLAPLVGVLIYGGTVVLGPWAVPGLGLGPWLFGLSAALSLCGSVYMVWMTRWDQGSSEETHLERGVSPGAQAISS